VFDGLSNAALLEAIDRALACYAQPDIWNRLQHAGMKTDYSWARSAQAYLDLYERIVEAPVEHPDCRQRRLAEHPAETGIQLIQSVFQCSFVSCTSATAREYNGLPFSCRRPLPGHCGADIDLAIVARTTTQR